MNLNYPLGQKEELLLRGRTNGEPIEYCMPFDLDERENYANGYLAITKSKFFVLLNEELALEREIKDGKDYKVREMGSSGILECVDRDTGELVMIARFTLGNLKRIVYSEGILECFAAGDPVKIIVTEADDICPECGKKFIKGTKMCPHCKNRFGVFKRLFAAVKDQWYFYAAIIILFFVNSLFMLIQPEISKRLINDAIIPMAEKTKEADIWEIMRYVGLIALTALLATCIRMASGIISNEAGARLSKNFRVIVYEKLQSLSIRYLDTRQIGDLMNRVNSDTDRIKNFISNSAVPCINEIVLMISVIVVVFTFDWKLGLIVLAPTPFIFVVMNMRKFHQRYHRQWVKMDKMNSTLNNILNGIRVVKAFGQEEREIKRFCDDAATVRDITTSNEQYFYTILPIVWFVIGFGGYIVTLYCGIMILDNRLTIGEMMQYGIYASYLYNRLGWLTGLPRSLSDTANAAQRIYEIVDEKSELIETELLKEDKIEGGIDVEDVSFGYLSYKPVLKNIELNIKQGEMIGIVGHSGAGKSTFINLLMRLYDADEGKILIDGRDLREYSTYNYKSQIGVVLQEAFLFSGTVKENIMYSKPDATFPEIVTAAKIANAHDFIVQLPNGYDTKVGERGHSLSGGERQRISIARAVLNNPRILILDEATASVDTETEQAIQEAFSRLIKGRTTFAIAHRLSTLKNADRIMVIDKGKLIELGSHKELMEIEDGVYHGLVLAQRNMSRIKAL